MDERIARFRTHQKNIDRYESLLKTELNEVEFRFLEGRLSEERIAMAKLDSLASLPGAIEAGQSQSSHGSPTAAAWRDRISAAIGPS